MEMNKYDSYKDSGIDWIGRVPKDWTLMTVRRITDDHKQGYYSSDGYFDEGYKLVRITDLDANGNIDTSTSPSVSPTDKELEVFQIKMGDILFPRTGSVGLVGVAKEDLHAVFASYLIRFRFSDKSENNFMRYFFTSEAFLNGLLSDLHGGVNQNIHAENIKDQFVALPSKPEQTAIANFLDHKTAQIDDLVRKKEELIELLKEERTAIINQAVTKGLNPNVPMKDSGIEWLDEIPTSWHTTKVKFITDKIGSGVTPRGGAEVYQESGIPLLRSQNIYFDHFKLDNVAHISEEIHAGMRNSQVREGDVLLNITGGSIGRCFYVSDEFQEANVNQHVCIVRPNSKVNTRFLHLLLSSDLGQNQIFICQLGGNREALNFEQLKNFDFAIPNRAEQDDIIDWIDSEFLRIDTLRNKIMKEIELIKEYKTTLISEVVTGKVDVRVEKLN